MIRAGLSRRGHPRVAAGTWLLTIHYFVAQIVAASAWPNGYSWIRNSISDLGVSSCGVVAGHVLCSPLSAFFNLSLIGVGTAMALGAVLVYEYLGPGGRLQYSGFACLGLAGVGGMLLGAFPRDSPVLLMHHIGALLSFGFGTVAVLVLAFALGTFPKPLRVYTFVSGVVSVIGVVALVLYFGAGLGAKGMAERVGSYPTMAWLPVCGIYLVKREKGQPVRSGSGSLGSRKD